MSEAQGRAYQIAAIDEIAAMSCWLGERGCTGDASCSCAPKPAAVASARQIAGEMSKPVPWWYPSVDGGVVVECFDDDVEFRGVACVKIRAEPDGTIVAIDKDFADRQWKSP